MRKKMKFIMCLLMIHVSCSAFADQALAKSKNCFACHAIDKALVGPAYTDVAAKYAGDKEALEFLTNKIQKGGEGVWGNIPMPANTQVNEAQARKLAAWVLGLKK
jgi:cytochrome c